jgi:hypothetical protein
MEQASISASFTAQEIEAIKQDAIAAGARLSACSQEDDLNG